MFILLFFKFFIRNIINYNHEHQRNSKVDSHFCELSDISVSFQLTCWRLDKNLKNILLSCCFSYQYLLIMILYCIIKEKKIKLIVLYKENLKTWLWTTHINKIRKKNNNICYSLQINHIYDKKQRVLHWKKNTRYIDCNGVECWYNSFASLWTINKRIMILFQVHSGLTSIV